MTLKLQQLSSLWRSIFRTSSRQPITKLARHHRQRQEPHLCQRQAYLKLQPTHKLRSARNRGVLRSKNCSSNNSKSTKGKPRHSQPPRVPQRQQIHQQAQTIARQRASSQTLVSARWPKVNLSTLIKESFLRPKRSLAIARAQASPQGNKITFRLLCILAKTTGTQINRNRLLKFQI